MENTKLLTVVGALCTSTVVVLCSYFLYQHMEDDVLRATGNSITAERHHTEVMATLKELQEAKAPQVVSVVPVPQAAPSMDGYIKKAEEDTPQGLLDKYGNTFCHTETFDGPSFFSYCAGFLALVNDNGFEAVYTQEYYPRMSANTEFTARCTREGLNKLQCVAVLVDEAPAMPLDKKPDTFPVAFTVEFSKRGIVSSLAKVKTTDIPARYRDLWGHYDIYDMRK